MYWPTCRKPDIPIGKKFRDARKALEFLKPKSKYHS